jgi:hypothetical protein
MEKMEFSSGSTLEQYNVEAIFKQASAADGQFKDDILSIYPSTFLSYNPGENNSQPKLFKKSRQTEYRQVNIREWSTATIDSEGNQTLFRNSQTHLN